MLFLAGAVVMLLILGISIWRAIGSEGWPRTVGQIMGAEVIGGGDGGTAHVSYRYEVKGRGYQGSRVRFGGMRQGWTAATWDVADYRVGRTVNVAYDPSDPERSVLEPGVHRDLVMSFVAAVVLFGVGVFQVLNR